MPKWIYEERPLNGGAGGEAFRIVFNGSGMEPAATLAREAIQNSVDASLVPASEVEVDFRIRELIGDERAAFEAATNLDEIARRTDYLDLPRGHALQDRNRPLRLLYIEDRRTTGLSGDPTEGSSKLRKLLMEIGGSEKTMEEHSGGSYGFGKAVYGGSSRIATIVAYSRTTNGDDQPLSVLMGCTYHRAHTFDGEATTGRGFFGTPVEVQGKGVRFDPITGNDADRLAAELGMQREEGDIGTSILIIDTPIQMNDICHGIEEYWWPRLQERLLDVVLIDANGEELHPKTRARRDLKPFIDAFDAALQRSPPISGRVGFKKFNKQAGHSVGALGLAVMREDEEEAAEELDLPERQDTIALIRSPLMVVEYYGKRSIGVPPVAGAFVADDEIDGILRRSEPPEHDRWSANALRLDQVSGEGALVKSVHSRVWRELKEFQKKAKPEEGKKPRRLLRLERALADWFGSTTKKSSVPGEHDPTPVSIRPNVRVEASDGGLTLRGSLEIALKSDASETDLAVRIELSCLVREEDGVSSTDPVPISVDHGPDVESHGEYWVGVLTPQKPIVVSIESEPYDPSWTVRFVPEVKPVQEGIPE